MNPSKEFRNILYFGQSLLMEDTFYVNVGGHFPRFIDGGHVSICSNDFIDGGRFRIYVVRFIEDIFLV